VQAKLVLRPDLGDVRKEINGHKRRLLVGRDGAARPSRSLVLGQPKDGSRLTFLS
jgi:hypothetical protein